MCAFYIRVCCGVCKDIYIVRCIFFVCGPLCTCVHLCVRLPGAEATVLSCYPEDLTKLVLHICNTLNYLRYKVSF